MSTIAKSAADVFIRPARPHDLTMLCSFIRSYYAFDHIYFDPKMIRSGLNALIKDESIGQVFLIIKQEKPIGYTILTYGFDLEFGGRTALMTDLYVEPNYRRQGIGRKTVRLLEQFCRRNSISALELQVERANEAAQKFYRRLKFEAHDRIPMSKRL